MSFPNIIFKDYGAEKETGSAKLGNLPLGCKMILPDGREYHHAQAGGTGLGAGVVTGVSALYAGHGGVSGSGLLASATTTYNQIGDTDVYLLSKSGAFTENQYADGYMCIDGPAASSYLGHVYKIKANDSCAVSSELHVVLEDGDGLQVALKAGTTLCSFRHNEFDNQIVAVQPVSGVTPVAVSANYYYWSQTKGVAAVETSATVAVNGSCVQCDTATAGSVTVASTADYDAVLPIGSALGAAAASQAILVKLNI